MPRVVLARSARLLSEHTHQNDSLCSPGLHFLRISPILACRITLSACSLLLVPGTYKHLLWTCSFFVCYRPAVICLSLPTAPQADMVLGQCRSLSTIKA